MLWKSVGKKRQLGLNGGGKKKSRDFHTENKATPRDFIRVGGRN